MKKVGFYFHEKYLSHDTGIGHPERPDRLRAVIEHLQKSSIWSQLKHKQPKPVERKWIELVHPATHIQRIERRCKAGERILDEGDTRVCEESFDIALLAVGAALQGIDDLFLGETESGFCAVRPPGHHAEQNRVMGFCLFNNIAIAARYAQKKYGIAKIAIMDWDVHHGNGTQEIFYDDDSVLFISLHQYPFYPGTGAVSERGRGKGEGYTLNCPMSAGSGEKEYVEAFDAEILPKLNVFQPELVMISAGFDAHRDDPLAQINLTETSFARFTELIREVAERHANGRIVSVLEGGYNLEVLAKSVEKHLEILVG